LTFEEWFERNLWMPVELSPELLRHYKTHLANCWNAALDTVHSECGVWPEVAGGINVNICRIGEVYLTDILRAKIS